MGKVEKWEKECLPSNYLPRASLEEKYLQMANGQFRATDHYELCVRIQSRMFLLHHGYPYGNSGVPTRIHTLDVL